MERVGAGNESEAAMTDQPDGQPGSTMRSRLK